VLVFGELSTGAADDLAKATDIARSMVMRYGMDERLGLVSYEPQRSTFLAGASQDFPEPRQYSEATAREIDEAVHAIVDAAFDKASEILGQRRELLTKCAEQLLQQETLSREELLQLVGKDFAGDEPRQQIKSV
jgi:cell division protease FtsH